MKKVVKFSYFVKLNDFIKFRIIINTSCFSINCNRGIEVGRFTTGKKVIMSVNVDSIVFEKVDEQRGDVPRSVFVNKLLRKELGFEDKK